MHTADLVRQTEKIEAFVNQSGVAENVEKRAVTRIQRQPLCKVATTPHHASNCNH